MRGVRARRRINLRVGTEKGDREVEGNVGGGVMRRGKKQRRMERRAGEWRRRGRTRVIEASLFARFSGLLAQEANGLATHLRRGGSYPEFAPPKPPQPSPTVSRC